MEHCCSKYMYLSAFSAVWRCLGSWRPSSTSYLYTTARRHPFLPPTDGELPTFAGVFREAVLCIEEYVTWWLVPSADRFVHGPGILAASSWCPRSVVFVLHRSADRHVASFGSFHDAFVWLLDGTSFDIPLPCAGAFGDARLLRFNPAWRFSVSGRNGNQFVLDRFVV